MQIEVLKLFCDVVKSGSISRAALENGLSQPSASQSIHQLEERLNVLLFDRSHRPISLTAQGQVYYGGVRDFIAKYFELEARVRSLGEDEGIAGVVTVAAIYSVGLAHMNDFTRKFEADYPRARVRLEYHHPADVLAAVRGGDAELGLISYPKKWPDLAVYPWREETMVLAVHPEHRLAGRDSVDAGDLEGERFVAFTSELPIRAAIDRFLRSQRVSTEIVLEFDNLETIKRAVELPSGLAILPAPTLEREVASGSIRAIPFRDPAPTRPLAVLHRKAGNLGSTTARFLRLLRKAV